MTCTAGKGTRKTTVKARISLRSRKRVVAWAARLDRWVAKRS
jgi:hypothetical protein